MSESIGKGGNAAMYISQHQANSKNERLADPVRHLSWLS